MSFSGKSPSAKRIRYTPQSVDPVNPQEGDFFYSDGTPRIAGPWVYQGGAWQQVQTSGALSTVNDLTFLPQSADPTPATGKVFYADGTSRAEGLWLYDGSQWVQLSGNSRTQEFFFKDYYQVTLASTGSNIPLTNVATGFSIDSTVLATNDLVLLKDQAVSSENGVYIVALSGPPARASGANVFSDLNNMAVIVNKGTVNRNTTWFQNSTLTSFSSSQSWTATPQAKTFTVPADVTTISVTGVGGGGGGGGGGGVPASGASDHGGGGGAGGSGATIVTINVPVTPGETISITLGEGGSRALGQFVSGATAPSGGDGVESTLVALSGTFTFPGAIGGAGGICGTAAGSGTFGAGAAGNSTDVAGDWASRGGNGQSGSNAARPISGAGQRSFAASGGLGSLGTNGGGGGGGGASIDSGATGGVGSTGGYSTISTPTAVFAGQDASKGAGGGGGGGMGATAGGGNRTGSTSGAGGPGYVRISW